MNKARVLSGAEVVCVCQVADSFGSRLKGLLGKKGLAADEGLLLKPLSSVHTWFMRFPIDVVFLDHELRVLKVVSHLRPWRFAAARGAQAALELPAGGAAGLTVGGRVELKDPED